MPADDREAQQDPAWSTPVEVRSREAPLSPWSTPVGVHSRRGPLPWGSGSVGSFATTHSDDGHAIGTLLQLESPRVFTQEGFADQIIDCQR